ncbi:glycosyltransferase [Tenacibaculum sp. C7A-26P2]|uniref:glycosyltransferase n=1 Tax=Tenacibaculum sp. C7A-26P2 TaxID=3447504 RepID=UPI003F872E74
MNITIIDNSIIPVFLYGGTQRVIWHLGKELSNLGHNVTYLVKQGSYCNFANIKVINDKKSIWSQIPENTDIAHFQFIPEKNKLDNCKYPYVITMHGNIFEKYPLDKNIIFVSKNHAQRYGSTNYVYNGLDWNDYMTPDFKKENYFHFLGKAAWRLKNVQGAINIIKNIKNHKLRVLGGYRFNFNMGIRLTFSPKTSFYGMVGGSKKNNLLNKSKGLIFPVLWHEPFGLAITESLYFGCPVFGTPYGSLKELVPKEFGYLSNNQNELTEAIKNTAIYSPKKCHEYAADNFNSKTMALNYIKKYEEVLNGKVLNSSPPELTKIQESKFLTWNT